jgi:predicted DNA-binding transcriptional regulator YafY
MSLEEWKALPRRQLKSSELGSDPVSLRVAYALDNGLSLEILYASSDNLTRRTIWPKYVERVSTDRYGTTYLRAYCETRGEDRTFRLDRMREARVPDGPPELQSTAKKGGATATPKSRAVAKSGGCMLPIAAALTIVAALLLTALS